MHRGEREPAFTAEKMGMLVLADQAHGVAMGKEIAAAFQQLNSRGQHRERLTNLRGKICV
jgi:hypothetical protein